MKIPLRKKVKPEKSASIKKENHSSRKSNTKYNTENSSITEAAVDKCGLFSFFTRVPIAIALGLTLFFTYVLFSGGESEKTSAIASLLVEYQRSPASTNAVISRLPKEKAAILSSIRGLSTISRGVNDYVHSYAIYPCSEVFSSPLDRLVHGLSSMMSGRKFIKRLKPSPLFISTFRFNREAYCYSSI